MEGIGDPLWAGSRLPPGIQLRGEFGDSVGLVGFVGDDELAVAVDDPELWQAGEDCLSGNRPFTKG